MGDSQIILGGEHVSPRAWVERLSAVGFEVELPEDLRPVTGGTFGVRLAHPDVTGGKGALVRVGVLYHALAAGAPAEVVEHFESRFAELVEEGWPGAVLVQRATSLGWAKDGRAGVLRYFEMLRGRDVEIDEEVTRTWSDPSAKLEQSIELWASDHNLCSVVVHEVFARAIADATGGRLAQVEREPSGDRYLTEDAVRSIVASARGFPARFELSAEDAERWPRFEPFVSWEQVRAEEAAEDAEEEAEDAEEEAEEEELEEQPEG